MLIAHGGGNDEHLLRPHTADFGHSSRIRSVTGENRLVDHGSPTSCNPPRPIFQVVHAVCPARNRMIVFLRPLGA